MLTKKTLNIQVEKLPQYIKIIFILVISINVFLFSCKRKSNDYQVNQQLQKESTQDSIKEVNYTKQKDTTVTDSLEFFNNIGELGIGLLKVTNNGSLTIIANNEKIIEKFYNPTIIPIFFKPDYDIFYIVCVSKEKESYKIQIDKNNTAILPKKENVNFLSWDKFLLNTTGISNLDWKRNLLKSEPSDGATILKVNEENDFIVIDVQNEWIQISNEDDNVGWIKWKQEDKLLIEVYLLI